MASRKRLKKAINLICSDLFADCVALSLCQGGREKNYEPLMAEVMALCAEYVTRISHTEPGGVAPFYRQLRREFTEKANALSEKIINA